MRIFQLSIIIIVGFLLNSCADDMSMMDVAGSEAQGDVFIKAVTEGDSTTYSLVFYTYSNMEMKSVKVFYDDNPAVAFELDTIEGRYTFARFPSSKEFTSTVPPSGNYLFDIEFVNGKRAQVLDYLSQEIIAPPVIERVDFDTNVERMDVRWKNETGVSRYKLMLVNNGNNIIYESDLLPQTQNNLSIAITSNGWYNDSRPKNSDPLRVVLQAFLFERNMSMYEIQCMSVNNQTIVSWNN